RLVRRRPEFHGSVSPAERRVLAVWSRVLGHEVTSPVVSFFDAGGDSLLTLELYLGLRAEYGSAFPMHDLFRFPTARSFAARPTVGEPPTRPHSPTAGIPHRAAARITELADRRRSSRRQGEPQ
ncbi:MAG: acyl carrier protein, partial [Myxococcales bacterium]|nr:acyl carrier protein [Myxococcales bacterium]